MAEKRQRQLTQQQIAGLMREAHIEGPVSPIARQFAVDRPDEEVEPYSGKGQRVGTSAPVVFVQKREEEEEEEEKKPADPRRRGGARLQGDIPGSAYEKVPPKGVARAEALSKYPVTPETPHEVTVTGPDGKPEKRIEHVRDGKAERERRRATRAYVRQENQERSQASRHNRALERAQHQIDLNNAALDAVTTQVADPDVPLGPAFREILVLSSDILHLDGIEHIGQLPSFIFVNPANLPVKVKDIKDHFAESGVDLAEAHRRVIEKSPKPLTRTLDGLVIHAAGEERLGNNAEQQFTTTKDSAIAGIQDQVAAEQAQKRDAAMNNVSNKLAGDGQDEQAVETAKAYRFLAQQGEKTGVPPLAIVAAFNNPDPAQIEDEKVRAIVNQAKQRGINLGGVENWEENTVLQQAHEHFRRVQEDEAILQSILERKDSLSKSDLNTVLQLTHKGDPAAAALLRGAQNHLISQKRDAVAAAQNEFVETYQEVTRDAPLNQAVHRKSRPILFLDTARTRADDRHGKTTHHRIRPTLVVNTPKTCRETEAIRKTFSENHLDVFEPLIAFYRGGPTIVAAGNPSQGSKVLQLLSEPEEYDDVIDKLAPIQEATTDERTAKQATKGEAPQLPLVPNAIVDNVYPILPDEDSLKRMTFLMSIPGWEKAMRQADGAVLKQVANRITKDRDEGVVVAEAVSHVALEASDTSLPEEVLPGGTRWAREKCKTAGKVFALAPSVASGKQNNQERISPEQAGRAISSLAASATKQVRPELVIDIIRPLLTTCRSKFIAPPDAAGGGKGIWTDAATATNSAASAAEKAGSPYTDELVQFADKESGFLIATALPALVPNLEQRGVLGPDNATLMKVMMTLPHSENDDLVHPGGDAVVYNAVVMGEGNKPTRGSEFSRLKDRRSLVNTEGWLGDGHRLSRQQVAVTVALHIQDAVSRRLGKWDRVISEEDERYGHAQARAAYYYQELPSADAISTIQDYHQGDNPTKRALRAEDVTIEDATETAVSNMLNAVGIQSVGYVYADGEGGEKLITGIRIVPT